MPRLVADLPDALVGAAPRAHRHVSDLAEEVRVADAQRAAGPAEEIPRLHQLTERVELQLPGGAVSDPHRRRPAVAGQVIELELREQPLAGDPVHDLQILRSSGRGPLQPALEGLGLGEVPEQRQRRQRERGVADPGEAVVPVAHAADPLGQGRRPRRHDGSGRGMGEGLQHQRRSVDAALVVSHVGAAGEPRLPEGHGLREALHHGGGVVGDAVMRCSDRRRGSTRPRATPPRRHRAPSEPSRARDRRRAPGSRAPTAHPRLRRWPRSSATSV